jgi:hypothetical protein
MSPGTSSPNQPVTSSGKGKDSGDPDPRRAWEQQQQQQQQHRQERGWEKEGEEEEASDAQDALQSRWVEGCFRIGKTPLCLFLLLCLLFRSSLMSG